MNVLTYHNDNQRTGANINETILKPANVNSNTFGLLYSNVVDGYVYAQPLVLSQVTIPGRGVHNVLFVATEHDSVYAFDADATTNSAPLWQVSFINPAAGVTTVPAADTGETGDLVPEIGITGTPVIDAATGTLYVEAKTKEVGGGTTSYVHRLHALDASSGAEKYGGPVMIQATVPGAGDGTDGNGNVPFIPLREVNRPGLLLLNGVVFIGYGSHGDQSPFHGWVLGYGTQTLQQVSSYCTSPNGFGAAIWHGGGGLGADSNGHIYFMSGNGSFDTNNAVPEQNDYGDSFVKLSTTSGLKIADYFTPANQDYLSGNDIDVSSGGPLLLPDSSGTTAHPHLLVGAGKEGTIYLLDQDHLGGFNAAGDSQIVQELPGALGGPNHPAFTGGLYGVPAFFDKWVYFVGVDDIVKAYLLSNGKLSSTPVSTSQTLFMYPGGSPAVSAQGNTNGILWVLQNEAYGYAGPSILHAYDASNVGTELYNSQQAGSRDAAAPAVKFTVPTVANGKVYVGGQYAVSIYGLLSGVIPANPGVYQGLFFDTNSPAFQSSGFFNATVGKANRIGGYVQLGASRYLFSGNVDAYGVFSNSIPRRSNTPLSLTLYFGTNGVLTGLVTDGANWNAQLTAYPRTYSNVNPAPQAGKYTVWLSAGADSSSAPGGVGVASLRVDRLGNAVLSGLLGDGTPILQRAFVSSNGELPFYVSLYSGNGSALGWLDITNEDSTDIDGQLNWFKLARPSFKLYSGGFSLSTRAQGSVYAFTNKIPVLNLNTGLLWLANGNLPEVLTNDAVLNGTRLTGSNKLSLTISAGSGFFSGRVLNANKSVFVHGALFQKQNVGYGFFVGTNQSGSLTLEP